MRILIIDDSPAIRNILEDVLGDKGHKTETAETIDQGLLAIERFEPDIIIVDSEVNKDSGIRLIDELDVNCGLKIIMMVTGKDHKPVDNPLYAGSINKPFNSNDVLILVQKIVDESSLESEPKKILKNGFFNFKKKSETVVEIQKGNFVLGNSYVVFEKSPSQVYKVASDFRSSGNSVLVVTSEKAKAVREALNDKTILVMGVSPKPRGDVLNISKLGSLLNRVVEFINSAEKPVIVLDNLKIMVEYNDSNSILTLIHQILNIKIDKEFSLVVSTDEEPLTKKERSFLLERMEECVH